MLSRLTNRLAINASANAIGITKFTKFNSVHAHAIKVYTDPKKYLIRSLSFNNNIQESNVANNQYISIHQGSKPYIIALLFSVLGGGSFAILLFFTNGIVFSDIVEATPIMTGILFLFQSSLYWFWKPMLLCEELDSIKNKILHNHSAFPKYIKYLSKSDALAEVIQCEPTLINYIEEYNPELCTNMIANNPKAIQYVKQQTLEMCIAALKDPSTIKHIRNQTAEMAESAIAKDKSLIRYVTKDAMSKSIYLQSVLTDEIEGLRSILSF